MKQREYKTYPVGTICVRCAAEKKDRDRPPCYNWGTYYKRHLWNDEELTIEVVRLKPSRVRAEA